MKLSGIIPSDEQLKLIQGVEGELLRRKRTGRISGIIALAVAVLQVMLVAIEKDYITNIGNFFNNLIHFRFDGLIGPDGIPIPQLTGMLVLAASVGTYFLFRWTNFMLKESEEPFRYTFWIKPFEPVKLFQVIINQINKIKKKIKKRFLCYIYLYFFTLEI